MLADLHTHTNASDGILSPFELVKLAKKQGLAAIAITDHDTVDGLEAGIEAGKKVGITVVPGVELSTQLGKDEIHILGYFIDYTDPDFRAALKSYSLARINRGKKIVEKLQDLGIYVDWNKIMNRFGKGSIGRPHIARALLEKEYVGSIEEAFDKYLNPGASAYVPRLKLEPKEAIKLIKSAKGVPVLAHPGIIQSPNLVARLVPCGLMGIEVYYPLHDLTHIQYYKSLCKKYNLVATGGSDYHGIGADSKKKLGLSYVGYHVVEKLRALKGSNS